MGFPTRNDHFGVFWGYHTNILGNPYVVVIFFLHMLDFGGFRFGDW